MPTALNPDLPAPGFRFGFSEQLLDKNLCHLNDLGMIFTLHSTYHLLLVKYFSVLIA
jgi:hypothetical protein